MGRLSRRSGGGGDTGRRAPAQAPAGGQTRSGSTGTHTIQRMDYSRRVNRHVGDAMVWWIEFGSQLVSACQLISWLSVA